VNAAEWTLGAVLYEDELAAIEDCEVPQTTDTAVRLAYYSAAYWVTSMMLSLVISEWFRLLCRD